MSKTGKIITTAVILFGFFFITGIVSYYEAPGFVLLIMAFMLFFTIRGIWKKEKTDDLKKP